MQITQVKKEKEKKEKKIWEEIPTVKTFTK